MQISVTFRHMDSSDALRQYAVTKIERLGKFFDGIVDAYVTLDAEKNRHTAHATVNAAGTTIRAEEASQDMYASIDLLADKIYRQLKKHHDKTKGKHKKEAVAEKAITHGGEAAAEAEPSSGDSAAATPESRIVSRKAIPLRPMFPDDAVLELDRSGLLFHVFLNAETEAVNVLYRRPDGGLVLLEPSDS